MPRIEFHAGPKGKRYENTVRRTAECWPSRASFSAPSFCTGAQLAISSSWRTQRTGQPFADPFRSVASASETELRARGRGSSLTNIAKSAPPTWAAVRAVAFWVSTAACAPSASIERSTDRTRRRGRRDGIIVISRASRITAALSSVPLDAAGQTLPPRGKLLPFPSRPPAVGAAKARRVSSMNAPTAQTKIFQRIFATYQSPGHARSWSKIWAPFFATYL